MTTTTMAKPTQTIGVDIENETVITGRVVDDYGQPIGGASVLLLDDSHEFTAELIATPAGTFRFFASPGTWTVRALADAHEGDITVAPVGAGIHNVDVTVKFS